MNSATLINQTSGECEYYTDPRILNAAHNLMGHIHLDPASSEVANRTVKADVWFGPGDGALHRTWHGTVWMNHPFGRAEEACAPDCDKHLRSPSHKHHAIEWFGNAAWIDKLVSEYQSGRVSEACCITYACTSEKWFQPLLQHLQCFLCPRTNYFLPDGKVLKGVTKGSVVTYIGINEKGFRRHFGQFGVVK